MNMKSRLSQYAMLAMIMASNANSNLNGKTRESNLNFTKRDPPIPKGCKRYYYNENGICCQSEAKVYFDAMKPSYAKKKYDKWKSNHPIKQ